jgi:hypothetical protein
METESWLQNAVFYMNDRTMDNVQNCELCNKFECKNIIYARHHWHAPEILVMTLNGTESRILDWRMCNRDILICERNV